MDDKDYDRLLRIKTSGTREWQNQSSHYNRYEATPYVALDELFRDYTLKRTDGVVDFGCGKGRLAFYLHHRFQVSVTGIEMSAQLYQEALENQLSYRGKSKQMGGTISFECCLAEDYEVAVTDNYFYFFNPFSVQIFMKVIARILRSVEQQKRTVDIILYYPTIEYSQFLETVTPFVSLLEVKIPGLYEQNDNERFLVFRLAVDE
ncbi:class I SAM-dependent methyltransferase [Sporosarcina beigongshangi]|uniref:class I SAM-dependent methyltransferase n=1 Tax=Sporosarcina beigongshangi TaxID=2782538 RepID=UPI00193AB7A2|nr:class I SAM-dependent methyltransferase [Sporosarcina beigongshangi]